MALRRGEDGAVRTSTIKIPPRCTSYFSEHTVYNGFIIKQDFWLFCRLYKDDRSFTRHKYKRLCRYKVNMVHVLVPMLGSRIYVV